MPQYGSRAADRIAMLLARQGEIAARGAEQSGQIWGRMAENLGAIGAQAYDQYQVQKEQRKRDEVFSAFLDSGEWRNPQVAIQESVRIFGPKGMQIAEGLIGASRLMESAKNPEEARKALPMVARGLLAAPPSMQPGLYANAGALLEQAGLATRDQLPQWGPEAMEYVKAIASEGRDAPETETVRVRNADGTETIHIVEKKPGQMFTSAAEPQKPGTRREAMDTATKRLTFVTDAEIEANPGRYQPIRSGVNVTVAGRGGGGGGESSPLDKLPQEWRTVVDRASLMMPGIRRPAFDAAIGRIAATGDMGELGAVVKQAAIEGENVDTKNQLLGRQATIASLQDTGEILSELKAKGVPTGWLTGNVENLARRLGKTTNPEYVALGNRLMGTLINYRRAATGVAFSARESADYERMFPNYRNELPVNEALITGLLREMTTYDRAYWEHKLGKKGAELVGAWPKDQETSKASVRPRARNPKTGEVVEFNGTKWVPVKP